MNILDANLLIYVYDLDSPHNRGASKWFERLLSSAEPVGIPLQSITAFLRVMTNRRLRARMPIEVAVAIVDHWFTATHVRLLTPGERHWPLLRQLLVDEQITGTLISDAQIAASGLECGGTVLTADRDFRQFPSVRSKKVF